MFSVGGGKSNIRMPSQGGANLTLLVFVLGILSLTSIGIMTLSVVKQLRPAAFSAINKQINYQGKLQNSGGITIADGNYLMKFSIYDAASGGSRLWTECGTTGTPTSRTVAVANGVFSVMLGDTSSGACPGATNSNAINLDFNSDSYYLGLTVESDSEMTPRKRIGASGYAFNADMLDGLDTSAVGGSSAFVPVTDGSGHLTLTQNLNLGGVLKNADGTAASPSYTFTSDPNTGLYSYGADKIGIAVNGSAIGFFDSSLNINTIKDLVGGGGRMTIGLSSYAITGANTLTSNVADSGSAIGLTTNTPAYTTSGAKLQSWKNNNVEKAYIDKDGNAYVAGVNVSSLSASSAVYTDASKNLTSTAPTSGTIGYWSRTGTTLSPATANDVVSITGNSGDILTLTSSATGSANKALSISQTGATVGTDYGAYISNNGAATTNVGLYATASGATNNYAAVFDAGYVGVGTTSPAYTFDASSSGTRTINSVNSNNSGYAIYGTASATGAVTNYGAKFSVAGDSGYGVYSEATATGAVTNYGGYFTSAGNSGMGVRGNASATGTATNYGLYGVAAGNSGRGVYGSATATGAVTNYGGLFYSAGNTGIAVQGDATATGAVANYGGAFYARGDTGAAVVGDATSTNAGQNFGGYFYARGTTGVGVLGVASATGAYTNYGGSFTAAGNGGQAVRGNATATGAVTNYGGYFSTSGDSGRGVYSQASATGAVTNYGGYFTAAGDTGYGIVGAATSASGVNYGVYGSATSASGWGGYFTGGLGLYASAARINSLTSSSAVYTDASKNLTSTAPTSGSIGYWSRSSTTLSTATAGDTVSLTGGVNLNRSPLTGAYVAINPWSTGNIGSANGLGLQMNRLLGANTGRYTITTSGFSGGTSNLYDSFYDSAATIPYGGTGVVTVNFNPQLAWTANTASPSFTYVDGMLVMSFYYSYLPTNVTVEMYRYNSGTGLDEWTTCYNTTTNNQNPLIISSTSCGINYIKQIRFTFSGGGHETLGILITELEWFPTRESSGNQLAVIPKYYNQNMDVSWTNWNMKSASDWSTTATISNAGNAYFAGTVGIGTASPATSLHVAKDSTYNSENTAGIKITDSTLTDVGLALGADPTNDIAYIQSMDPGTGYTRPLSINPNGGPTRLFINRNNSAGSGISWYSPSFTAWSQYMAQAAQTNTGPTANITAPSGTIVTSWALRSFVENAANYGWTFESGTSTGQPSVVAEIRSSDGTIRSNTSVLAGVSMGVGDNTPDASLEVVNDGSGDSFLVADTNDGDTTPFVIQSDGDVGIGTASPGVKVDVVGDGSMIRVDNNGGAAGYGGIDIDSGSVGAGTQYSVLRLLDKGTNYWEIRKNNSNNFDIYDATGSKTPVIIESGALTNSLYIDSTGYIGLNTTTVNSPLHIVRDVADGTGLIRVEGSEPDIIFNQSGASWTTFTFQRGGTDMVLFGKNNNDDFYFSRKVGSTWYDSTLVIQRTTGNVGIGDSSPAALLTVGASDVFQVNSSGAIAAATGITSSGTINFSGLSASSAVYTDASKNLTSTAPTSGTIGYWSRTGTTLSPATANDVVSVTGSGATAITGTSSAAGGKGVYGTATDTTAVANYGGYFTSAGTGSTAAGVYGIGSGAANLVFGVYGQATATGAYTNYGGVFNAAGNTGRGVYGEAIATGAYTNYGGYFYAKGDTARGVYGYADASTGAVNYGGYFQTLGTGSLATGVYGEASGAGTVYGVRGYASNVGAVTNYGGAFTATGTTGRGVYGQASSTAAAINYGGYFVADGTAAGAAGVRGIANGGAAVYGVHGSTTSANTGATGVYGEASGAASDVIGVQGAASSSGAYANYGGYFSAAGSGTGASGVYGLATAVGTVYGVRGSASAVDNATSYGGYFTTAGYTGRGVYGYASYIGATVNYGGYFEANGAAAGAAGVRGIANGGAAVYGVHGSTTSANTGATGVYGEASGAASDVIGVQGAASSSGAYANYGGYFSAAGSGTGASGVYGLATAVGTVYGVRGSASAVDNATSYGGYFTTAGYTGRGVYGYASYIGATVNYGGYFEANGAAAGAAGVRGIANANAAVYGVYGSTSGQASGATGVYGLASATADVIGVSGAATGSGPYENYGGVFSAAGDSGRGVYGSASASGAVTNYGGYFTAAGSSGSGVYARATGTGAVTNIGGYFQSDGNLGIAVSGWASSSSATVNYGGKFLAAGTGGAYGVYGEATGLSGSNYGVYGKGPTGVYGYTSATQYGYLGSSTYGVYGRGTIGVYGTDGTRYGQLGYASAGVYGTDGTRYGQLGTGSYGVYGYYDATHYGYIGDANYGVYGTGGTGEGVRGDATTGYGVRGNATTGYGVSGFLSGETGRAVWGSAYNASGTAAYGGYFSSAGTSGYGVYAEATAKSTVYGVYGTATDTGAGTSYGGYFSSAGTTGYGVYGSASTTGATVSYGGYFISSATGTGATGVLGTTAAAGTVYGVQGTATNSGAVTNYGGYFTAAGDTGRAVYGAATDSGAVANYGGYFSAAGTSGAVGVYGVSSGASGTNYGVYGQATSGWAGYFTGAQGIYVSGTASQMTGSSSGPTLTVAATSTSSNNIAMKITWADSYLTTTDGGPLKIVSSTDTGFTTTGDAATRRVGLIQVDANVTSASSGNFIAFNSDVNGTSDAEFRVSMAGATYADGAYSSAGADLAEVFDVSDLSLSLGDLVVIDSAVPGKLKKSSTSYEQGLVGVITDTTMAAFIGGNADGEIGPGQRVVTLLGRMSLTKVNDENGPINVGDLVTSSSTPGVAMKATKPGPALGRALGSWSGPGQGTVEVYVNQRWHSGGTINTDGAVSFFNDDFTFDKKDTATEVVQGYDSKGLTFRGSGWDGALAQDVEMKIGNVVTGISNYKLSVLNNAGNEVAYIGHDGSFGLAGKFYPASTAGAQTDAYIFYAANYMRTNADGWSTGSFDFAEMFLSHETLEPGDVVVLDEVTNEYVKKSTEAYDVTALGIVSTKPGFLAGANVDFNNPSPDQGYPIALAGRVPTKVSVENGPVRPGDYLTTSSTPGVAMKATESGLIIGTALESWDGPGIGAVKVFVNLAWYNIAGETAPVGEMAQLTLTGDLNMAGNYILNVGKIVGQDERWSIDENGILKIKLVSEDATEKEMFGLTSDKVELTISGSSRLENGVEMIDLSLIDPDFIKNISAETPLKVIVTLTEPANGIYVAEKTAYSFRVAELNAGTSDAAFDWIVIARRKGYEDPAEGSTPPPAEPAPTESTPAEPAPSEPAPSEPAPETPAPEPAPAE